MPHTTTRPRLFYERRGSGEPLLCITGFGISSAVFTPVLDLYARDFECITYDNRGSGRSQAPLWPTSMPELAADAAALLDALGIESAHVYGVSMGGMIAQELALRFPDRVRGLVLGCCSPGGPRAARPTPWDVRRLADPTRDELRAPIEGWLAPLLFSPAFRREHPERVAQLLRLFTRHRAAPQGVAGHWMASFCHDTVSRLGQIRSPTLVIQGELDAICPVANARLLAGRIPQAELAIVPGAGHAYALEAPEESFRVFAEWFERHAPIPGGPARRDRAAAVEALTRPLGLPIGLLRTGGSLAVRLRDGFSALR